MHQELTVGGVSVAFTDTTHGNFADHTGEDVDTVRQRREALAQQLGVPTIAFVSQVHSARVVQASDVSAQTEADAILSPDGTAALGILTADCLPVIFVASRLDTEAEPTISTAVAHAGRRGLLDGVLINTLQALWGTPEGNEAGQPPVNLDVHAWIGPAICGGCYEVPADMAGESEALLPGIAATTRWGTTSLDLPGAARRQLEGRGVTVHLEAQVCTLEDERYYSYRRDKTFARMAALVFKA